MSACEINDSANMKALDKQWETGVDMTRATIAEVAELSGVSQATVSRALRGAGKVAPKTRAKVEAAADRLGFTLSKSASSLASGKTMRVVLLFSGNAAPCCTLYFSTRQACNQP